VADEPAEAPRIPGGDEQRSSPTVMPGGNPEAHRLLTKCGPEIRPDPPRDPGAGGLAGNRQNPPLAQPPPGFAEALDRVDVVVDACVVVAGGLGVRVQQSEGNHVVMRQVMMEEGAR